MTYHIGNLSVDRANSHDLHELAEAVAILRERGVVACTQLAVRLSVGHSTIYSASRTGAGRQPRNLSLGLVDAFIFRAIEAITERDADTSAIHAIRDHLGCNGNIAADLLACLWHKKLIEEAAPKGWKLTVEGHRMLM